MHIVMHAIILKRYKQHKDLSRSKMDGFCYIQTNFKKTDTEGIYGYYNFIEWLNSSCYNVEVQN